MSTSLGLKSFLSLVVLLVLSVVAVGQDLATNAAAKLLPNQLGEFRAVGPVQSATKDVPYLRDDVIRSWGRRSYVSASGASFSVGLFTTSSDSGAYSLLTEIRKRAETKARTGDTDIGTSGFSLWDGTYNSQYFYRGRTFVEITEEGKSTGMKPVADFARALAATLDRGEGDIPVLVKHLPNWLDARRRALYIVSLDPLKSKFGDQSVFSVVDFEGGAEAVNARYDNSELVIVEFNTPQRATDNHGRITAKLQELSSQGQPAPTAYRRVGNYAVFVFDAPSQEAANNLIDQVKYEQMVQWLGENPYRYEKALRDFSEPILGVFVNVVKGSGLALISCLAVGSLIGGLLFIRRRAQQREMEAFSDAGAMLRLNLDDLTPEIDPARLLGPGK